MQAQRQFPVDEYGMYGGWDKRAATTKRDVRWSAPGELGARERGEWKAGDGNRGTAVVNQEHGEMAAPIIEHELTHGLTLPPERQRGFLGLAMSQQAMDPVWGDGGWAADTGKIRSEALARLRSQQLRDGAAKLGVPEASLETRVPRYDSGEYDAFFDYVGRQAEIDPRLAEIRRRYTHTTGNKVRTPEDAKQAWNWWQDNAADWQFVEPAKRPTMDLIETRFLNQLPDTAKNIMYRRMTHIPVAAGAAVGVGASQQPGVLSGLTEER